MQTSKYAKISDPIEVVQFTGGAENGAEIVGWVRGNGRGARWEDAEEGWESPDGKNDIPEKPEQILLKTPRGMKPVLIGDWIAKGEDGNFRCIAKTELEESYVSVPGLSEEPTKTELSLEETVA